MSLAGAWQYTSSTEASAAASAGRGTNPAIRALQLSARVPSANARYGIIVPTGCGPLRATCQSSQSSGRTAPRRVLHRRPEMDTEHQRHRVVIEGVAPEIDCGRFAIKRTMGERVVVEADIFTEGHDALSAVLLHRRADESEWT